MVKFPEANARLFKDIFICLACKSRTRTSNMKVMAGKASCRKCGGKTLRPIRKK
jgi:ribosomal protein L40E